ncbi:MAG TPA: hypothetical protein VFU50_18645 [Terriglobales bacterium]|nr:hypothetical protein [Terriglobales bacterium]
MKFPKRQSLAVLLLVIAVSAQQNRNLNEANAVGSVRVLNTAEATYANRHPQEGFACTLSQLASAGLINAALASGRTNGYRFSLNCGGAQRPYVRVTVQSLPNGSRSGVRAFCSDLYLSNGKIVGGAINVSNDGRADTCFIKGEPLQLGLSPAR